MNINIWEEKFHWMENEITFREGIEAVCRVVKNNYLNLNDTDKKISIVDEIVADCLLSAIEDALGLRSPSSDVCVRYAALFEVLDKKDVDKISNEVLDTEIGHGKGSGGTITVDRALGYIRAADGWDWVTGAFYGTPTTMRDLVYDMADHFGLEEEAYTMPFRQLLYSVIEVMNGFKKED